MKNYFCSIMVLFLFSPWIDSAQQFYSEDGKIKVTIVKNPFSGSRSGPEQSQGPEVMEREGLKKKLGKWGCRIESTLNVELTKKQAGQYGVWHRLGLSNGHLAKMVAESKKKNCFTIGLLSNCNSLMGMLGGLQHSSTSGKPLKVGLVWIDAHGDFNTPETTLSGMLGGMPVAVSAGLCLTRLRLKSGLDPALPPYYIVMAGVRDTDPLEQELIDRHNIRQISVADLRNLSKNLHNQMKNLTRLTDIIYVHIDMDVLDPREVMGHSLNVPNGPTSKELARALTIMFSYPKTAAFGIASYPVNRDTDKLSLKAAHWLIEGAIQGIKKRK